VATPAARRRECAGFVHACSHGASPGARHAAASGAHHHPGIHGHRTTSDPGSRHARRSRGRPRRAAPLAIHPDAPAEGTLEDGGSDLQRTLRGGCDGGPGRRRRAIRAAAENRRQVADRRSSALGRPAGSAAGLLSRCGAPAVELGKERLRPACRVAAVRCVSGPRSLAAGRAGNNDRSGPGGPRAGHASWRSGLRDAGRRRTDPILGGRTADLLRPDRPLPAGDAGFVAGDPALHPGRIFPGRRRCFETAHPGFSDPGRPFAGRACHRRGAGVRLLHLVHRRLRRDYPGAGGAAAAGAAGIGILGARWDCCGRPASP
jgi:hypothetical protein